MTTVDSPPLNSIETPPVPHVEPCYPPMAGWRLLVLIVCSFMLYIPFWVYRICRDNYNKESGRAGPVWYAVGIFVPLVGIFVFYHLASMVSERCREFDVKTKFSPGVLTFLFVIGNILTAVLPDLLMILAAMLASWPLLSIQGWMNRIKLKMGDVEWREPVGRFTWRQRVFVTIGVVFLALVYYGMQSDLAKLMGERLAPGRVVEGITPGYKLTVADNGWTKVAAGTLSDGSDLELMGQSGEIWVLVRIDKNNISLNALVSSRAKVLSDSSDTVPVSEKQRFMYGADLVPYSIAFYREESPVLKKTMFYVVGTTVLKEKSLEVIARGESMARLEQLVNSLEIDQSVLEKGDVQ